MFVILNQALPDLLKEFKDVSTWTYAEMSTTWTYAEMSGLDPQLVMHQINTRGGTMPVKQPSTKFMPNSRCRSSRRFTNYWMLAIIKPIQHQTWLG